MNNFSDDESPSNCRRLEERIVLDAQKIELRNMVFDLCGISVLCEVVMIIVSFLDGTLSNLRLISRNWYMVSIISHPSCDISAYNLFRTPPNVIKYTKSVVLDIRHMTIKDITYAWEPLSPTRLRSLKIHSYDNLASTKFWRIARDHEIMVGLKTLIFGGMPVLGCGVEMRLATIFPNLSKVVYPPFIQWCIGLIHLETLSWYGSHDLGILEEFASLKHLDLWSTGEPEDVGLYLAKTILPRLESLSVLSSRIDLFEHITEDLPLKKLDLQYTTTNSLSTVSKYTRLDSLICSIDQLRMMKSQLNVLTSLYVTGGIDSQNKHGMTLITEALVKSRYWRRLKFSILDICDVEIQILREAKVININFWRKIMSFRNIEQCVDLALISHRETKPEWCCLKIKTRSRLSSEVMRKTVDLMSGKGFRLKWNGCREVSVFRLREK